MLIKSNSQLTVEQKNLIFFFLEATDVDKTAEGANEIILDIFEMENYFESIENKNFKERAIRLEGKILNLIDKLKNKYFEYGVAAREISEYKLSEDKE